jgi:DNA-binding transcriptional regulator YhcF (GntR family)|nr:MAG TPA: helix-turn-helix domain protein [Bacteriophage sp.]
MNKDTMEAFPSLDTIKKETGCALNTIRKAILALEREGAFMVIRKSRMPNVYKFTKLEEDFERYTFEFLDKD